MAHGSLSCFPMPCLQSHAVGLHEEARAISQCSLQTQLQQTCMASSSWAAICCCGTQLQAPQELAPSLPQRLMQCRKVQRDRARMEASSQAGVQWCGR